MRGSVTSFGRNWPSTIIRRAVAKSIIPISDWRGLFCGKAHKRQARRARRPRKPMSSGAADVAPGGRLLYSGNVGKTRHLELQRPISNRATWRSGDAADCKSAYPGSIPGVASKHSQSVRAGAAQLCKGGAALLYAGCITACRASFPGSSAVEQPAVNRLVAGSNPARGARCHFRPRSPPFATVHQTPQKARHCSGFRRY